MKLRLIEKRQENEDTNSFIFKPEQIIEFQAGQYLFYTLPHEDPDNRGITRYFTIASAPFEKNIMLTTRINDSSSTFKKTLSNLKIGSDIEASGPDGNFTINNSMSKYIFIAGGIGITPFRSILLENANNNIELNVQLLYANKDKNVVFKDELESLKKINPTLKINYFISPTHIDPEVIKKLDLSSFFYISGPSPFVRSIRDLLKEQKASSENIKLDFFPGYSV